MAQKEIPQIALVGSESLMGRELRDLLRDSILGRKLKLLGTAEAGSAILTEEGGEAAVIGGWDEGELNDSRVVLLVGGEELSRKALEGVKPGPDSPVLVDLTRSLEDHPGARLRAPQAEIEGEHPAGSKLYVIAHPAAILSAVLLRRLAEAGEIRRAILTVFEPASERGMAGLEELQQQTVSLLSFKKQNTAIYDEQLAFNVLARFGEEAPLALETIQEQIERHIASLISRLRGVPMPSVRLLQAAVMHGYTLSAWVLFAERPELARLEELLKGAPFDYRPAGTTQPNPVGMASQSGIAVGALEPDRNEARAIWVHAAADNFRLVAENALGVMRGVLSA